MTDCRVNIFAANDHHVIGAAHDVQVVILIDEAQVADGNQAFFLVHLLVRIGVANQRSFIGEEASPISPRGFSRPSLPMMRSLVPEAILPAVVGSFATCSAVAAEASDGVWSAVPSLFRRSHHPDDRPRAGSSTSTLIAASAAAFRAWRQPHPVHRRAPERHRPPVLLSPLLRASPPMPML